MAGLTSAFFCENLGARMERLHGTPVYHDLSLCFQQIHTSAEWNSSRDLIAPSCFVSLRSNYPPFSSSLGDKDFAFHLTVPEANAGSTLTGCSLAMCCQAGEWIHTPSGDTNTYLTTLCLRSRARESGECVPKWFCITAQLTTISRLRWGGDVDEYLGITYRHVTWK